ncbi:hypothetical protein Leryth_012269, partial [Lithospermum erythrorhizon]
QDAAKVSTIIDLPTRTWNLDSIQYSLTSDIARLILATPVSLVPNSKDSISWVDSPDGNFKLSIAYDQISKMPIYVFSLEWIWSLKTHPRVKTFIWLTCLDKLPTKSSLFKKHLIPDHLCSSCFSEELCRHFLWECPRSLLFWKELGLTPTTPGSHLTFWIKSNCSPSHLVPNIPAGILFLIGLKTYQPC